MCLSDWVNNGWLHQHTTSKKEIDDLLKVVDRDLRDCRTQGLSLDGDSALLTMQLYNMLKLHSPPLVTELHENLPIRN
jgi:hypothetical protein